MSVLSGPDALDPERGFALVVAYPHSSNLELRKGGLEARLSLLSRMSIDAAVAVWRNQESPRLAVIGETLFPFLDLPSTTALMACRAHQLSDIRGIDLVQLSYLRDGRPLNNTYLQTRALAEHLDERNRQKAPVLVETLDYHMDRVRWVAKAYGVKADFVTAEAVLEAVGNRTYDSAKPFIDAATAFSEPLLKALTLFDRRGRLLNWRTQRTGGRVVDVVFENGKPTDYINTTAKERLAVVQGAQRILASAAV